MILLDTSGAVLGSLAAAALCDAALGRCDAPQVPGVLRTLGDVHPREAVSRQMNDGAVARNPHATDRPVARTGWINHAMGWQPGQPLAMQRVYQLHVLHTGRPAVASQQVGLTSPRCRCRHHRLDVFVRGHPVVHWVGDVHVTGQVGFPIDPPRADQGETHDHPMRCARPMATSQRDGPAGRLVPRRVVDHQPARGQRNTVRSLRPPGVAIRATPVQQPRGGIMRRTIGARSRLASRCCCGAARDLCGYQKVDIVQFVTRWRVHRLTDTPSGRTA